jgi:hypothetical protein
MEGLKMMVPVKSHSMRSAFKACPRLVYFRYVAGIQRKETLGPKLIGKAFHIGLEAMRKENTVESGHQATNDYLDKYAGNFDLTTEKIKIAAYLTGYAKRFYQDWSDPTRPIQTEVELLSNNDISIIDAVIDNGDGTVNIIEDKTTTSLNDGLEKALKMNEQLLNYHVMAANHKIHIASIRYRETQKSTHRINKNESLDAFRARITNLYTHDENVSKYRETVIVCEMRDMLNYAVSKYRINKQIDDAIKSYGTRLYDWPFNGSTCIGKFGVCEYAGICAEADNWENDFEPNGKTPIDDGWFIDVNSINGNLNMDTSEEITND